MTLHKSGNLGELNHNHLTTFGRKVMKRHLKIIGPFEPIISKIKLFILAGIISLALRGGPVLGIDFTGGTIVQIQMESSPDVSELRSSLDELNIGISEVQTFGSSNEIIIRIKDSYKSILEKTNYFLMHRTKWVLYLLQIKN